MRIAIYQVRFDESGRDYAFRSYDDIVRDFGNLNRGVYDKVYDFDVESSTEISLDDLYEIFNLHRPDDFKGHSMSVSDVVETPDGFWFCDSFGWKKIDWEKE